MYVMTRPKEASSSEYRERLCSNTTGTLHHYPRHGTAADDELDSTVAGASSTKQQHQQKHATGNASTPPMMGSPQPSTVSLSEEEHDEINTVAAAMAYKYPPSTPIVRNAVHFQQFGSRPRFLEHELHHEHQLRQQYLKDQAVKELLYVPPIDDGFANTATSQFLKNSQQHQSPKSARGTYTSALRAELSALMKDESSTIPTHNNNDSFTEEIEGGAGGVKSLISYVRGSLPAYDILNISSTGGGAMLGSGSCISMMTLGDEDRRSLAMNASCRRGSLSREGGVVRGVDPLQAGSLVRSGGSSGRLVSASSSPSPLTRGLPGVGVHRRKGSMTSFTTMGDMEQPLPSTHHLLPHPSLTRAHSSRTLSFARGASMVANASKAISGMRGASPASPLVGGGRVSVGDINTTNNTTINHHPDCSTPILGREGVKSVSPMMQASSVFGQYAFDIQPDSASSNHTTDFTEKMKGEILSRTRSNRTKQHQQRQHFNSTPPAAVSLSSNSGKTASRSPLFFLSHPHSTPTSAAFESTAIGTDGGDCVVPVHNDDIATLHTADTNASRPRNQSHTMLPTEGHPDSSIDECPSSAFSTTAADMPSLSATATATPPDRDVSSITSPVSAASGIEPGSVELLREYKEAQRRTSITEYYNPILATWSGELERYTRGEISWLEKKQRSKILSNEMAAALAQHRDKHKLSRDGAVRRAQEVLKEVGAQIAHESAALQESHARECADMQSSLAQLFEGLSVEIATAEIDYPLNHMNAASAGALSTTPSVEIHADANASPRGVVGSSSVASGEGHTPNTASSTSIVPLPPSASRPLSFAERIKQGEGTDRGRTSHQREVVPASLIPPPSSEDGGEGKEDASIVTTHRHRPSVGQITRVPTPPPKPFAYFPAHYLTEN